MHTFVFACGESFDCALSRSSRWVHSRAVLEGSETWWDRHTAVPHAVTTARVSEFRRILQICSAAQWTKRTRQVSLTLGVSQTASRRPCSFLAMSRYCHTRCLPAIAPQNAIGEGPPHAPRHECRPCQSHSPGSALRVSRLARLMGQLATRRSSACLSRSAIFFRLDLRSSLRACRAPDSSGAVKSRRRSSPLQLARAVSCQAHLVRCVSDVVPST